jgi:hypothetical protein
MRQDEKQMKMMTRALVGAAVGQLASRLTLAMISLLVNHIHRDSFYPLR